jgi:hypothetical protein
MATLVNVIKKVEKFTGEKISIDERTNQHTATYKDWTIQFFPNGRISDTVEATNFYTTKRPRTENDRNSDYWPGTFHNNIAQALKFIK